MTSEVADEYPLTTEAGTPLLHFIGKSLSHGTMVDEDLIDTFMAFLEAEYPTTHETLRARYEQYTEHEDDNDVDEGYFAKLFDALNELSPGLPDRMCEMIEARLTHDENHWDDDYDATFRKEFEKELRKRDAAAFVTISQWRATMRTKVNSDEWKEWKGWLLQDLFDAIDGLAPNGTYFGANEGDGSDYGFWSPMLGSWDEEWEFVRNCVTERLTASKLDFVDRILVHKAADAVLGSERVERALKIANMTDDQLIALGKEYNTVEVV